MHKRVLFVEEENKLQESRILLEKAGFQVLHAQASEQALNIIHNATPDVIVTDLNVPGLNGYELCQRIKANADSKLIPIIVISDQRKNEDAYLYVGVQEFLVAPIDTLDLNDRISRQLGKCVVRGVKKCKVLVHNTNPTDALRAKELLDHDGRWSTEICMTIADLMYKSMTFNPDIILLDVFMGPQEVIRALRSFAKFKKVSILTYYSGKPESNDDIAFQAKILEARFMREACREAGANAYIGPLSSETFVSLLSEYHSIES